MDDDRSDCKLISWPGACGEAERATCIERHACAARCIERPGQASSPNDNVGVERRRQSRSPANAAGGRQNTKDKQKCAIGRARGLHVPLNSTHCDGSEARASSFSLSSCRQGEPKTFETGKLNDIREQDGDAPKHKSGRRLLTGIMLSRARRLRTRPTLSLIHI